MSIRTRTAGAMFAVALAGSAIGVIATAAPASAATGGNVSVQFCRAYAQYLPGHFIGPCTSYFQSHDHAGAAAYSAYLCTNFIVPGGGFATVGECVTAVKQTLGS